MTTKEYTVEYLFSFLNDAEGLIKAWREEHDGDMTGFAELHFSEALEALALAIRKDQHEKSSLAQREADTDFLWNECMGWGGCECVQIMESEPVISFSKAQEIIREIQEIRKTQEN